MSFPLRLYKGQICVRELLWAARLDDVTEAPAPQSKPGSAAAPAGRYLIIATGEPGGYTALSSAYAEVVQRLEGALGQAGQRHVEVLREPRAQDAIRSIEKSVRDAADAGETLLVYVGGHGVIGTDGDLVLLTPDALPGRRGTGLRTRDLHQILNAAHLPTPRVLVLDTFCGHRRCAAQLGSWYCGAVLYPGRSGRNCPGRVTPELHWLGGAGYRDRRGRPRW